jgi:hypothetical protein
MKNIKRITTLFALYGITHLSVAQDHQDTHLHVNPKWSECSFQLDPSLTQQAWHEFTKEAGLVAYYRPLVDARPMGVKNFEVSLLQWRTAFDDSKPAWNDTFVHPDSVHWLKESSRLAFPGITARVGITSKLDAAIYITKSPGANYGFYGGQLQYNLINNVEKKWSASARMNLISMYGPEDLKLNITGLDVVASKDFPLFWKWASISPYAGVSTYLSSSRETTDKVNLQNEHVAGGQAFVGTVLKLSAARIGVEYNLAKLNTISFKMGVAF